MHAPGKMPTAGATSVPVLVQHNQSTVSLPMRHLLFSFSSTTKTPPDHRKSPAMQINILFSTASTTYNIQHMILVALDPPPHANIWTEIPGICTLLTQRLVHAHTKKTITPRMGCEMHCRVCCLPCVCPWPQCAARLCHAMHYSAEAKRIKGSHSQQGASRRRRHQNS